MKLDGLAGGKVDPGYLVGTDRFCNKGQFFSGNAAGSHTETQHAGFSALLGVASIQAGKALIGHFVQIACIKGSCFFPEFRQIGFPGLGIDSIHIHFPSL